MLACFCLNILIETGNDFQKATAETLNLIDEEKSDSFFKQDVQQVGKLINITKIHSGLVQSKNVGSWTVTRCINCDCNTHAVHREKGASCVLIYSKLLNYEAISSLRSSDIFSTIFNIVVNPNDIGDDDDRFLDTYLPSDVEATIKNIRHVMSDFLRKETAAVEERIRQYTEEQYELLNNLKDRAYKEQESLVRVIRSTIDQSKPASTNNLMAAAESPSRPTRLNDQISTGSFSSSTDSPLLNARHTPKRQKSSPAAPVSSYDAEGLFEFEGSDDISSLPDSDADDSEKEGEEGKEEEGGISIPRVKPAKGSIAKSLPMNIPTFMSQPRNRSAEELDDILPQDDNLDIAASIKALAKSVHGDAVFGDLPRPRFSTQI